MNRERDRIEYNERLALVEETKLNGFMDCRDVMQGLGYDTARYSWSGAYRWIEDADEAVMFVLPEDGRAFYFDDKRNKISKAIYSGCYDDAFIRVLAYKEKYYADLRAADEKANQEAMEAAMAGMADYEERLARAQGDAEVARKAKQAADKQEREDDCIVAMVQWTGKRKPGGMPKYNKFCETTGQYISREDYKRLWVDAQRLMGYPFV